MTTEPAPAGEHLGWLFLRPDAVPERWRSRAVPLLLVPLLPEEQRRLLAGDSAVPDIAPEDETLAALVARGLSTNAIAAELGISHRTAQRRLTRLERRVGVTSKGELANLLASRSF